MMTLDVSFKLFFIAVVIDFLTGVIGAARSGTLKSRTCSDGMFRSLGELITLAIFAIVAHYIPVVTDYVNVFTLGFILKECISIMENLIELGVSFPAPLVGMLNAYHDQFENGEIKKTSKR